MRLDPKVLAAAIARAADPPIPDSLWNQLALALSKGEGVARAANTAYIVLRSPWDADSPHDPEFKPTLLCGRIPVKTGARRFRTTKQVIATLLTQGRPGKKPPNSPLYAPASTQEARVALGGVSLATADRVTVTNRDRETEWYDISGVPIGSFIYRVKLNGETVLFQCVGHNQWMLLYLQGTRDIVNLPEVLYRICCSLSGEIIGLEPLEGEPVLLRTPM